MFVVVVVRMAPNTGGTEHEEAIKLQNRGRQPRLAQNGSVIEIMINNEQSDDHKTTNATADRP